MSRRNKRSKHLNPELALKYCDQLHEDDGVDPKEYFKPNRKTDKANRKALQVCRQASQTLDYVLADCEDERMQNLVVASVTPAPDSSRLLVTVAIVAGDQRFDRIAIEAALRDQIPRLRSELARSINRKKVPNLVFQIIAFSELMSEPASTKRLDDERGGQDH